MSQTSSNSFQSFKQQNTVKQSVTSLRRECLESLRFPTSLHQQQSKPKTHLLAYMSEFITDQPEVKVEEIDDFCCFDRMKKIIEKKKVHNNGFEKGKNEEQEFLQNQKLLKFIQIQAKMKKMEQNLNKYSGNSKKQGNSNERKSRKSMQNDPSLTNLFLSAPVEQQWKDPIITKHSEGKQHRQNLPGRYSMKKSIREQGYKQYLEWQKKRLMESENDVKEFVETQIQQKVKTMLEERDIKFNQLLKQTKNLERSILQKNLQIQNLKSKQQTLVNNVRDLQAFKDLFSEENTLKNKERQIMLENFYNQFCQTFPNQTVRSLKQYIDTITDKCLQKFYDVECKKFDKWNEQKSDMNEKINKLQGTIQKYKTNENDLLNNLKEIRYEQSVATMEMDILLRSKSQLERLQKKILELYNDWYGKLSQSQKQLMKNLGYLQVSYEYEEMLQYIVVFKNKFSTDSKVNEYLIKVLRGIQRIRKILFPKTISNPGYKQEMMDPLYILEKLEKYIKCKVFQMQKKSNYAQKGSRMSQVIQQQFLGVSQSQDNPLDHDQNIKTPKTAQGYQKQSSLSFNNSTSSIGKRDGLKRQPLNKITTHTLHSPKAR